MRRGQQGELKALFSFGLICVVIASPIMTINTYRWYGWDEIKTPNVVNDLPPFKNFNLTMQETKFFAQVTELLADAKTKGQISNKARAMQFPNQPILYQVAGIEPADMHCPISWYDICPDRILELDYLTVTKDTIEVVMYYSLDPQEEESLNSFYRPGKTSVLSDIERHLKLSGRYRLAAKIPVPTAGNADLSVYFLNKGEK